MASFPLISSFSFVVIEFFCTFVGGMGNNNRSNGLIKWMVVLIDIIVLNVILAQFVHRSPLMSTWMADRIEVFFLVCNLALLASEYRFGTIIHKRMVSAGDVLRRVTEMIVCQTGLSYLLLKVVDLKAPVGWLLLTIAVTFFLTLIVLRLIERLAVKRYRLMGRNTRTMTFVGSDPELQNIYKRLVANPTTGYRLLGYYGEPQNWQFEWLNSLDYFVDNLDHPEKLTFGDEMYVCISRRERDKVRRIANFCDQHMIMFYYVPVSIETMGVRLKRELIDDIEVFSRYQNPLLNPTNKFLKRAFDIVVAILAILVMLPLLPIIAVAIRIQSPGPIFFKQLRTGLDGKFFEMYKFRSMHVNDDADRVQATRDDPRKFPFGNFMRKSNIDELPQFWNVLKGEMSVVGPRPHMLAHTDMYSQLIDKFMVRHFVKPGVTGWAQVTGFRGETHELWQMEGRVKRDIWYMENWSIWLDIRIIWLTFKTFFVHDKNAF